MARIFFTQDRISSSSMVILPREETHHLWVMRYAPGDTILIANGSGHWYTAQIKEMTRTSTLVKILREEDRPQKPRPAIMLGQAIPRFSRFEFILQKATELGVDSISPLQTERSFLSIRSTLNKNRFERWERIVIEAAKQSGRHDLPSLVAPQDIEPFLKDSTADLKICLWEEGERVESLKDYFRAQKRPGSISLLIGPEGSFSPPEIAKARASGFHTLSCGPRIMRVETAAPTCIALCQYEWGDF